MQHIIVPNRYVDLVHLYDVPLFFIAGPVRGGGDWQADACDLINVRCERSVVVVPTRWDDTHRLKGSFLLGADDSLMRFPRQLDYEQNYLDRAGDGPYPGCVIFWLATQKGERPPEQGPYAQDTYGELGEWRGRMMHSPNLRVVIGAEPKFPGLDCIKRNYRSRVRPNFPFYNSLGETIDAAIRMAKR